MAATTISLSEVNRLHLGRQATPGKEYVDTNGVRYYGTEERRLRKLLPATITSFDPIDTTLTSTDVQEVVKELAARIIALPSAISHLLIDYIATEGINAYQVVTSTGKVADSSNAAYKNKVIGIANTTTLNGFQGQAVGFGEISNSGWSWTIGDKIFLNGTILSTTAPSSGFIQMIGTAVASNTINVKLSQSILL